MKPIELMSSTEFIKTFPILSELKIYDVEHRHNGYTDFEVFIPIVEYYGTFSMVPLLVYMKNSQNLTDTALYWMMTHDMYPKRPAWTGSDDYKIYREMWDIYSSSVEPNSRINKLLLPYVWNSINPEISENSI